MSSGDANNFSFSYLKINKLQYKIDIYAVIYFFIT